jgi:hypothetical protein
MRLGIKIASKITLAVLALGIMIAPDAQACGKKPWDAGFSVPNLLTPLQESQGAQPLFSQQENPLGENRNRDGHSQIVGMWIVKFFVGDDSKPWDFAIEQFHRDGTEMTNDIVPPSVGNICWGVWEPAGRDTFVMKHTGLVFDQAGKYFGLFDLSAKLTVDDHGEIFDGKFMADQEDLAGNILPEFHVEGILKAKRFKIDSSQHRVGGR